MATERKMLAQVPSNGEAGATKAAASCAVHPRARAFMAEVAETRRMRRQFLLELDPKSALWRALAGGAPQPSPRGIQDPGGRPEGEEDMPGGASGAVARRGAVLSSASGCRFGLNNVQAYRMRWFEQGANVASDYRFGDGGATLEDAGRLGVKVVRHHGEHDLLWYIR